MRARRVGAAVAALATGLGLTVVADVGRSRPAMAATPAATTRPVGYWLAAADGGVFAFGGAPFYGSAANLRLAAPVVGIAADLRGDGYWLVGRDGGIFPFGGAPFYGSAAGRLTSPVVAISPSVGSGDGDGYVIACADGETVDFGDDGVTYSSPVPGLDAPVVGVSAMSGEAGGWDLVTARGQVVPEGPLLANFGDASGLRLNRPIVGIALGGANDDHYQLVAADGGVFDYGMPFYGSAASEHLNAPVVGEAIGPEGGYDLVAADGGVFRYGDAPFFGSAAGEHLNKPVVGMAFN